MTQIYSRLESGERGIEEVCRTMECADAARLKASFDALGRLALLYEESASTSESPTVACRTIEDATNIARERERLRKAAHASGGAWELEQSNASEHDVVSLAFNVADALVTEGDEIRVVSFK